MCKELHSTHTEPYWDSFSNQQFQYVLSRLYIDSYFLSYRHQDADNYHQRPIIVNFALRNVEFISLQIEMYVGSVGSMIFATYLIYLPLLQNSGIEKAFLFDVVSKIYIATDCSPVDMQSYELCCDMIDVVIDLSSIYRYVRYKNKDCIQFIMLTLCFVINKFIQFVAF